MASCACGSLWPLLDHLYLLLFVAVATVLVVFVVVEEEMYYEFHSIILCKVKAIFYV